MPSVQSPKRRVGRTLVLLFAVAVVAAPAAAESATVDRSSERVQPSGIATLDLPSDISPDPVASQGGHAPTERTVENATIMTAPNRTEGTLTSRAAVATAREKGSLAPTNVVARGDALVIRFESDWFGDVLAAQNASTPTGQFRSLLNESETSLRFEQWNEDQMRQPKVLRVTGAGDHSVVADVERGTYYVFVDLDGGEVDALSADGVSDSDYRTDVREGDGFVTNFTVGGERIIGRHGEWPEFHNWSTSAPFVVAEPEVRFGTARLPEHRLSAAQSDQRITVTTTLAPGTVVRLNATEPDGTRLTAKRFVVRPEEIHVEGHWPPVHVASTTVDLSGAEADHVVLTTTARGANETVDRRLVDPPLLRLPDDAGTHDGGVTVHDVVVPDGGYVAVLGENGTGRWQRALGHSRYLEPGTHRTVSVDVEASETTGSLTAVLYHSTPNHEPAHDYHSEHRWTKSRTRPYRLNGTVVADSQSTATPGPVESTVEPTTTGSTTAPPRTTATGDGLTAVSALVGLGAFGLVASRFR